MYVCMYVYINICMDIYIYKHTWIHKYYTSANIFLYMYQYIYIYYLNIYLYIFTAACRKSEPEISPAVWAYDPVSFSPQGLLARAPLDSAGGRKSVGLPEENHRKAIEKPLENHREMMVSRDVYKI